jgi:hypothetical protein
MTEILLVASKEVGQKYWYSFLLEAESTPGP